MKTTARFIFVIVLLNASLHAQKPATIEYGGEVRFDAPAQQEPTALTKIFGNLGPSTNAYYNGGWQLAGPNSAAGAAFWSMAFVPVADSHVFQLRAAIQYVSGANQVNLSLYSDAGGAPGVLLAGPVTVKNVPTWYTCCTLAVANLHQVAVIAGTQYWVVADTPSSGTGSDFNGTWAWVPPTKNFVADDVGNGAWNSFPGVIEELAGAVYGTTP